jgi:hypothetical protein
VFHKDGDYAASRISPRQAAETNPVHGQWPSPLISAEIAERPEWAPGSKPRSSELALHQCRNTVQIVCRLLSLVPASCIAWFALDGPAGRIDSSLPLRLRTASRAVVIHPSISSRKWLVL